MRKTARDAKTPKLPRQPIADRIKEVRYCYDSDDVNELLDQGWRLYGTPTWSEALQTIVSNMVRLEDDK